MANDLGHGAGPYDPTRVRREELIRPAERRRDFKGREAQRRLHEKERPRWAIIAYVVFLIAILVIFGVTYTTYAFSKYRGEILPGVKVDKLYVGELTQTQAERKVENRIQANWFVPVRLVYGSHVWPLSRSNIGLQYKIRQSVKQAMLVGRQESFVEQLIDRLPLHPEHVVPLLYRIDEKQLAQYVRLNIARPPVNRGTVNAGLRVHGTDVVLVHSQAGNLVDVPATENIVRTSIGAVTTQTRDIAVHTIKPVITDADALSFRRHVERFLNSPPVIQAGKRVFNTNRSNFIAAFSFTQHVDRQHASIVMQVNPTVVQNYVSFLASQIDRDPQNAKVQFSGGRVAIISPKVLGRKLDQVDASTKLLDAVQHLRPRAKLRFVVNVIQPSIDQTNPASLGITTFLGAGESSFRGGPLSRYQDIKTVSDLLNDRLIGPKDVIDFNQIVGTNWDPQLYIEREREVNGKVVPGRGGAMQQVATTLFRALYSSGLRIVERHSHIHRFGWYEPPLGLDATVSPSGDNLMMANTTHHYLLLQTRLEPFRHELWIYVYGAKLGWKISVDSGQVTKIYPHGPDRTQSDSSLSDGQTKQIAWAHDGADTVVQRTITYPGGRVQVNKLLSHYQAWQAVIRIGGTIATATPKTSRKARGTPTPSATTPVPGPSPTPTFNH